MIINDGGDLDFISKKVIGQSLIRLRYFLKHKRYSLIFEFIYYRFDTGWIIVNFKFDDGIKTVLGDKEE